MAGEEEGPDLVRGFGQLGGGEGVRVGVLEGEGDYAADLLVCCFGAAGLLRLGLGVLLTDQGAD